MNISCQPLSDTACSPGICGSLRVSLDGRAVLDSEGGERDSAPGSPRTRVRCFGYTLAAFVARNAFLACKLNCGECFSLHAHFASPPACSGKRCLRQLR